MTTRRCQSLCVVVSVVVCLSILVVVSRGQPANLSSREGRVANRDGRPAPRHEAAPILAEDTLTEQEQKFEYVIEGEKKKGTRRVVPLNIGGGEKMEFVRIPKGTFMMGAPAGEKNADDDEKPQRCVEITRDFYLGKYEVTRGQYLAMTGQNSGSEDDRLPIVNVSWDSAAGFCWTQSGWVKRKLELPTEAQWEYACRAGTTTPFHFGSKLNGDLANCNGDEPYGAEVKGTNKGKPVAVGSYLANPWGLHDMHGNVWEWCRDYYGPYDKVVDLKDPFQARKQSEFDVVLRGGSWSSIARKCRAAHRYGCAPDFRYHNIGFRVCLRLE